MARRHRNLLTQLDPIGLNRYQITEKFEVATLVKANSNDERDLQLFLESEVGIFLLEEDHVEPAHRVLVRLKGEVKT